MPVKIDPEIERVVRRLIERGSAYDVDALNEIYDDDQHLLFVRDDGTIDRVDRATTIAKFEALRDAGERPLSTEAELLHVEQQQDLAVVLLRRRMDPGGPSSLYELRLRRTPTGWRVSGETVTAWPGDARAGGPPDVPHGGDPPTPV